MSVKCGYILQSGGRLKNRFTTCESSEMDRAFLNSLIKGDFVGECNRLINLLYVGLRPLLNDLLLMLFNTLKL